MEKRVQIIFLTLRPIPRLAEDWECSLQAQIANNLMNPPHLSYVSTEEIRPGHRGDSTRGLPPNTYEVFINV